MNDVMTYHKLALTLTLDGDRSATIDIPFAIPMVSAEEAITQVLQENAGHWTSYFIERLTKPLDASLPNG